MAFSSLSPEARATILLRLKGIAQFLKGTNAAAASTVKLGAAVTEEGVAAQIAARKNFLFSQAMYTVRRYAYFGTLAIIGLGAAALKMGFNFDMSMQTTVVSLEKFAHNSAEARSEANKLFLLAAKTPFEFPDLSLAVRRLLPGLNGNLQKARGLVTTIGDSLAGFGITSGAALQRATLQLEHMLVMGRLTGQVLNNLGRDNIPMQQALEQAFHATGMQIKQAVSRGAISAQDAVEALTRYINDPRHAFFGAAQRLGLRTLQGNWTTFRDLVAASFGRSEMSGFDFVTVHLRDINKYLIGIAQSGGHLTITALARAIDHSLTPATHNIIHAFIAFRTALSDVVSTVRTAFKVVNAMFTPLKWLTGLFGDGESSAKFYGHALGILIDLWILEKTWVLTAAAGQVIWNLVTFRAIRTSRIMIGLKKAYAYWTAIEAVETKYMTGVERLAYEQQILSLGLRGRFVRFIKLTMIPTILEWAASLWAVFFGETAVAITLGAITIPLWLVVAAVLALTAGLVVLYFKWGAFHDIVDKTYSYLTAHKGLIAMALTSAFSPLSVILAQLIRILNLLDRVKSGVSTVTHPSKWSWGGAGKTAGGFGLGALGSLGVPVGPLASLGGAAWNRLPHLQSGGTVASGGAVMVGEAGREIVHLPAGASVTANHQIGALAGAGGGHQQPIVINLMLRERTLEQVIVDIMAKRDARR